MKNSHSTRYIASQLLEQVKEAVVKKSMKQSMLINIPSSLTGRDISDWFSSNIHLLSVFKSLVVYTKEYSTDKGWPMANSKTLLGPVAI